MDDTIKTGTRRAGGRGFFLLLFLHAAACVFSSSFYSPRWGFRIDLPEGYEYAGGNGRDHFSFRSPPGAYFDLAVYPGTYKTLEDLAVDVEKRLGNVAGEQVFFTYRDKKACLFRLDFSLKGGGNPGGRNSAPALVGWGICMELGDPLDRDGSPAPLQDGGKPLMAALAYGPADKPELEIFHLSALDSLCPSPAERLASGPVISFAYPRGELVMAAIAGTPLTALVGEHDAEAAQALVDREFGILKTYLQSPLWKEAWIRFYRAVYRDSFERLMYPAFELERYWNLPAPGEEGSLPPEELPSRPEGAAPAAAPGGESRKEQAEENRVFAEKALRWVQAFEYERDLMGSDFVNLVSALTGGRGDCDSRAMLWAIITAQAGIPAALMVSRDYGHAMGLADLPGPGARFAAGGRNWLVAETTSPVNIGLIGESVSAVEGWFAVIFE